MKGIDKIVEEHIRKEVTTAILEETMKGIEDTLRSKIEGLLTSLEVTMVDRMYNAMCMRDEFRVMLRLKGRDEEI